MKRIKLIIPLVMPVLAVLTLALSAKSQQPAPQQAASRFDITNYRIEAQIIPEQHTLRAGADITFVPLENIKEGMQVATNQDGTPLMSSVDHPAGFRSL